MVSTLKINVSVSPIEKVGSALSASCAVKESSVGGAELPNEPSSDAGSVVTAPEREALRNEAAPLKKAKMGGGHSEYEGAYGRM